MQPENNKRILVLGSAPHARQVTAYTWDDLPQNLNVADYEVVILNLVPLQNGEVGDAVESQILLNMQPQFARAFFTRRSEIIAIGVPNTKFGNGFQATWWLPIQPDVISDPGEVIRDIDEEFKFYLDKVNSYSFHLGAKTQWFAKKETNERGVVSFIDAINPDTDEIEMRVSAIGQTHFDRFVAFKLHFTVRKRKARQNSPSSQSRADIYWLPPTTEISDYDAVNLILRKKYGLLLETEKPEWVDQYKLPAQLPIEEKITDYEQQIQELKDQLSETRCELQGVTRFQQILYETGEDALEPVVRDVLRELEAEVDDPPPRSGREDGRMVGSAGRNWMLEIKGPEGSLKLRDIRQLNQWVGDAIVNENGKGRDC